ncbi:MAG: hypothetical protein J7M21_02970 [Planctomycetes bacterium]|nr:hypothetical protein [Planctomycetota bacterium]
MDDKQLLERLHELAEVLSQAPAGGQSSAKTSFSAQVPPPITRNIGELLDHIRLRVKYVVFDLEATRRENRYLRQMLERRTNFGDGPENP